MDCSGQDQRLADGLGAIPRISGQVGLQPRHARLAVASAVAFVDFVTETYRERQLKAKPGPSGR